MRTRRRFDKRGAARGDAAGRMIRWRRRRLRSRRMGGRGASTVVLIPLVVSSARESPARSMIPTACARFAAAKRPLFRQSKSSKYSIHTERATCGLQTLSEFFVPISKKKCMKTINEFSPRSFHWFNFCSDTRHKKVALI